MNTKTTTLPRFTLFSCLFAGTVLATSSTLCAQQQPAPASANVSAKNAALPAVVGYDPAYLAEVRKRAAAKDPAIMPALNAFLKEADKTLAMKPLSVMDKTGIADSGNKHDYFSLAPYYWPDPTKPNGLPYIRRDGETNPESKQSTDANAFVKVCNSIEQLGLAYYFSGNEAYADKAAELALVWFLDPATRMNPNLNCAQAIRGLNSGRNAGVLDGRGITQVTDGLALIEGSSSWPEKGKLAMRSWLEAFHKWLTTNKDGIKESEEPNNHGTWCNALIAHIEVALGKKDAARARVHKELTARIGYQILPNGRQPKELVRTRSFHYSLFNLEALFTLAQAGSSAGYTEGWTYKTADGRSLLAALALVAPYMDESKQWIQKDIEAANRPRVLPLIRAYLAHANDPQLRELYLKYAPVLAKGTERWQLLLPPVK